MHFKMGLATVAAVTFALAGCSQPAADKTAASAGAAADTAAAATSNAVAGATDRGGVVSPPTSPENDAINTDANKNDTALAAGSNSFTEGQARGRFENAGYSEVTGLTKTADGLWTATAKKGGKTAEVSLDFKGAVSAK